MGYELVSRSLYGRLERHNGPGDEADNEAWDRLREEIRLLIDADPDYRRIEADIA